MEGTLDLIDTITTNGVQGPRSAPGSEELRPCYRIGYLLRTEQLLIAEAPANLALIQCKDIRPLQYVDEEGWTVMLAG